MYWRITGRYYSSWITHVVKWLFSTFSVEGLIITVFVLEIVCMIFSIPDNGKMATIALIVIMLISQKNPQIPPIVNSSLRFLETVAGAGIGIAIAWLLEISKPKEKREMNIK